MRYVLICALAAVCAQAQNPQTASWPASRRTMPVGKDNEWTALTANISSSDLVWPVSPGTGTRFPAGAIVDSEGERALVCSNTANSVIICAGGRGLPEGTAAAPHVSTAIVAIKRSADYQNVLSAELAAVQGYAQSQPYTVCRDTGSTDAYGCAVAPDFTGYSTDVASCAVGEICHGTVLRIFPNSANTGAASVIVNSLPSKAIKQADGTTDPADNTYQAGRMYLIGYSVTAGAWVPVGGGATSGSGLVQMQYNGANVGSPRAQVDALPGTGITRTLADTGAEITDQIAVDTAVVATRAQTQSGTDLYCAATFSGSTGTCSMAGTPLRAYTTGMRVSFVSAGACPASPVINIDGLGAKALREADGTTDMTCTASQPLTVAYDGTVFRKVGASGGGASKVSLEQYWSLGSCNGNTASTASGIYTSGGNGGCGNSGTQQLPSVEMGTGNFVTLNWRLPANISLSDGIGLSVSTSYGYNESVSFTLGALCISPTENQYNVTYSAAGTTSTVTGDSANGWLLQPSVLSPITLPAGCAAGDILKLKIALTTGPTSWVSVHNAVLTYKVTLQ